jgi:hypothetical protein
VVGSLLAEESRVGGAVASLDHAEDMADDIADDVLMAAAANGASCPAGKDSMLQLAAFSR